MKIALIVLVVYLVLIFGIAWFFSRRESIEGYFLNKRKTSLWLMTFSNVATLIGAGATVAIVAEVYDTGISYGLALPTGFLLGAIILALFSYRIRDFGEKHGVYTIVDFFHKRFGLKNKILVGILQIFLLFFWIAIQAVAFASLASVLVGIDYSLALILASAVTIFYTAIGGLKIDILSDFIQFWIIFLIFIIAAFAGLYNVGGLEQLLTKVPQGHLNPFAFGGISWFIGAVFFAGFLFIAGTQHWQRIISAKNREVAKKSFLYSTPFLVILSCLTIIMGLVASVLFEGIDKNTTIFVLMKHLLSPVLFGIGLASILAIIMSSIDSLLIGGSTIIYRSIFGEESSGRVIYARLITALFGLLGFLVAFLIPNIITLSLFQSYFALIFVPPIIAGLYSEKTSSRASFYSLLFPFLALVLLFPIVEKHTFLITVPLGVLIILFYDKIFRRNPISYNSSAKE